MSTWTEIQIKNIALKITKGTTPTTLGFDFASAGINFIKAESITGDGNIVESTFAKISEKTHDALKRSRICEKDILVTIAGVYLGKIGLVRKTHIPANTNQAVAIIRLDKTKACPEFIKYFLLNNSTTAYLNMLCPQSAQPNLNLTQLGNVKFTMPHLELQQKIAAILSAYDDLIENNKRRIALLEKMAEEIYREWFVRFRFPGHDKVKFVKGVPAGWEVLPFSKAVLTNPVERVAKEVEKPYVGMEALSVSSMYFSSKEMRTGNAGSKFRNHDVLLPRITPSLENGKRGYVMTLEEDQVGIGSTEFIVFREKILTSEHIYLLTCSSDFRKHAELSMAGASGRQRVKEDSFDFFLVNVPPQEIRQRFTQIVRPYFSAVRALSNENINLLSTRDLLLPRLISGKLSVENLDIRFPPSMEETDGEA